MQNYCNRRDEAESVANETHPAEAGQADANAGSLARIFVDSQLLEKAHAATGIRSDRELAERALRTIIQLNAERELLKMQGTVEWEGDLDAMRADM